MNSTSDISSLVCTVQTETQHAKLQMEQFAQQSRFYCEQSEASTLEIALIYEIGHQIQTSTKPTSSKSNIEASKVAYLNNKFETYIAILGIENTLDDSTLNQLLNSFKPGSTEEETKKHASKHSAYQALETNYKSAHPWGPMQ